MASSSNSILTTMTAGHVTTANYTQSLLNEMKKFYKHVNQLNILLKETNNACKELKTLQQSLQSLTEDTTNLQINELDEMFIKSLQKKRICFVILGQNVLAQSIVINELLARYLLPFEITNKLNEENWRFVRIKHNKIGGYTYQLVDSEFEVMSSEQLNKKFTFTSQNQTKSSTSSSSASLSTAALSPSRNSKPSMNIPIDKSSTSFRDHVHLHHHHQSASSSSLGSLSSSNFTIPLDVLRLDESLIRAREQVDMASTPAEMNEARKKLGVVEAVAENHAILEVTLDLKLLENNVEILMHSRSMNTSILDTLLADVIPVYVYAIIESRMSPQDLKELNQLKPIIKNNPILFVKIPEIDKYIERIQQQPISSTSPPNSSTLLTSPSSTNQINNDQTTKKANTFVKYLSQQSQQQHIDTSGLSSSSAFEIFKQLCELNYLNLLTTGSSGNQVTSGTASSSSFVVNDYFFGGGESVTPYNYLVGDQQQPQHQQRGIGESSSLVRDESTTSMTSINGASSSSSSSSSSAAASIRSWSIPSEFCEKWHLFMPQFCLFIKRYLKSYSVRGTTILFKFHEYCLSKFINFAFEMARDMLVTPRKIEYAREKEQILYDSLLSLASMKQEELKNLINNAIETHREQILAECRAFQFVDVELINCSATTTPSSSPIPIASVTAEMLSTTPDDDSSAMIISSSMSSEPTTPRVARLSSSETDTLISSAAAFDTTSQYLTVRYARDYKKCTSQIQELVISRLNNAIGQKLIESVEILKENYLGTLKRCLITLEEMNNPSISSPNETNSSSVSEALQQIINAAYHVELSLSGSSSFLKILILRMKELMKNMPWNASPKLDEEWKVLIASNMLNSLSESKLAKILCNQMKERLKSSHNLFINSLKLLEAKHNGRLEKNEENQTLIRKILAPKFAKLCLESTSLRDYVLYGFPSLGREIGRGQYGVVYSCARWGRYENLAVKSVVPPDEKHWNDLALEFHYTKQIADHERIVKLLGSVIDYTYGNGQSPAVLLIMEAMRRDLYSALKSGLDWKIRIRISVDVVNGIRYLHSLGLVHRDIKLKNVLLDEQNRAKITDLGFCKPEAMMSGSIVGTPVHMCPEMFNSKYDNTVDIYAFGILFWYICSGAVILPRNFESCGTKDDLWSAVKRGVRPERLPNFDDQCWSLMEMCWQHDPKQRPHIGVVYDLLMAIMAKYNA